MSRVRYDGPIPPSELAVLKWLVRGKSNNEIGIILNKSPLTIKNQVQTLIKRLGAANRLSVAITALQKGLVSLETLDLTERSQS